MPRTPTTPAPPAAPVWADPDHGAWLGLSARTGQLVAAVAGRTDVIAYAHPGAPAQVGSTAAACFVPALGEARFDTTQLMDPHVDPAMVDPMNHTDRGRVPVLIGAVCHEAGHAGHTRLRGQGPGDDRAVMRWATLLEEPRVEGKVLADRPGDRRYLRASFEHIIGTTGDQSKGRAAAAAAVCLILGRVHAGVLDTCDATTVWDQVEDTLGPDLMIELDALTAEACTLDDDDTNGLVDVATRFAAALDEHAPTGRGGDSGGDNADDTGADDGDGDGDGPATRLPCGAWTTGTYPGDTNSTPPAGDPSGPLGDAIRATAAAVTANGKAAAAPPSPPRADPAQAIAAQAAAAAASAALQVFPADRTRQKPVTGSLVTPTADEAVQVAAFTARMRRAQYRGVQRTKVRSQSPPGTARRDIGGPSLWHVVGGRLAGHGSRT